MQSQGARSEHPSDVMMTLIVAFWVLQKAPQASASPWVQKASLWTSCQEMKTHPGFLLLGACPRQFWKVKHNYAIVGISS